MEDDYEEWLSFALETEEKGLSFYKSCLDKTKNMAAKELFRFLVSEEEDHIKVLGELTKGKSDFRKFVRRERKNPMFPEADVDKLKDKDLPNMLNKAIEFEDKGMEIYNSVKTENEKSRALLERLVSDEVNHKARIKELGFKLFPVQF